jgi:antitoxin (DNA-binding transcriptional repressor) of toxin-antitoxin stability system
MGVSDPVLERIAAHSWPRGGVRTRRVRGGYTLISARTGAPVARLKPLPSSDGRFEVLWWRRETWGAAGPFGAVLELDDALAFIASEPAFWIRA